MANLTIDERVEVILLCGREGISHRGVADIFNARHQPNRTITHQSVGNLLKKFKETGSVKDKKRGGNIKTVANEETNTMVLAHFVASPQSSLRRTSNEIGVSKSAIHRILQQSKWHPYKIQLLQKLNEDDPDRRSEFCYRALEMYHNDNEFPNTILFTDEANFYLNGEVNKQNMRFWSDENPHWMDPAKEQGSAKVMVWCGIWNGQIIGPFFFDHTVNAENYLQMLQTQMMPILQRGAILPTWFQQDGAPPHYAILVRDWLNAQFPGHWIGRRGTIEWPARSPDLSPCDFYLWGALKAKVYAQKVNTVNDLKQRIIICCREIMPDVIHTVIRSWSERLQLCFDLQGQHFEHL